MDDLITLDPTTVVMITALVVPILVGLLTKLNAPSGLKSFVMLLVSALSTLLAQAMTEDGYAVVSQDMFKAWIVTTVTAVATYYGAYRPMGITQKLMPEKGIGSGTPD